MTAVIDIGSNSVRLLYNGIKYNSITQLSEGLMLNNTLSEIPMARTINAVKYYFHFALSLGALDVNVFATEAVRSAKNSAEFVKLLQDENIPIDIIDSYTESKIAFLGAYNGGTKAILDVGGASSELAVGDENGIYYSHSLPLGGVRLKDYSQDKNVLLPYIKTRLPEYGKVPHFDELISIGGTSSSLAAIYLELEPYDTNAVHNFIFSYNSISSTVNRIIKTPINERINIKGMHPKKTLILPCGGLLILGVMEYLNVDYIRISELDNLEGYLKLKVEK
ncbi:MAG TPA: hypothetical protein VJ903_03195 [Clostridia bacterium]|nr:hypothetical protein [Clostridia bacterium]